MSDWATLKVHIGFGQKRETTIREAIKRWFNMAPPDEDPTRFDSYVRCIPLKSVVVDQVTVDTASLHPITDAFLIFYHYDRVLSIIGGVPYKMMMQLGGSIKMGELRTFHNRNFEIPYRSRREGVGAGAGGEAEIYWPHWSGDIIEYATFVGHNISLEAFSEKLQWYRTCDTVQKPVNLVFSSNHQENGPSFAILDKATSMMARLLADSIQFTPSSLLRGSPIDPRILRMRFDTMRWDAEYHWFKSKMSRLTTEQSLINFFKFNHIRGDALCLVAGTPLDHQMCFAARGDTAPYPPDIFLNVPVEELPEESLKGLPIYQGGFVHLPFYWDIVTEWLWNKYMIENQRHYTRCKSYKVEVPLLGEWIAAEQRIMLKYLAANPVRPQPPGNAKIARPGTTKTFRPKLTLLDKPSAAHFDDIEDLWTVMPPCLLQLKTNQRFPKNAERLRFVGILFAAGISVDSIRNLLDDMNNQYPKEEGHQELHKRFPLDYILTQNYGVHVCGNMVGAAMKGVTDVLKCPFVGKDVDPALLSQEEVTRNCKNQCVAGERIRFRGPAELIENELAKRGQLKQKDPAVPPPLKTLEQIAAEELAAVHRCEKEERKLHKKTRAI
jgi:hypothetical protein